MPAKTPKLLIAANWKAYVTKGREAASYVKAFTRELPKLRALAAGSPILSSARAKDGDVMPEVPFPDIVICPPALLIGALRPGLADAGGTALGAQDLWWEDAGPYTGALTPGMFRDAGATWTIVGHSERRRTFGDTDEHVHKKLVAALGAGLGAILCIGEWEKATDDEGARASLDTVKAQLGKALEGVSERDMRKVVITYEPVWAISKSGSGVPDTPDNAARMVTFIRRLLAQRYGDAHARTVRIIYGGSVSAQNAAAFMREKAVDGLLVGNASTNAKEFTTIIAEAITARR